MKALLTKKYTFLAMTSVLLVFFFLITLDFYYTWQGFRQNLIRDANNGAIYAEETTGQILSILEALGQSPVLHSGDGKKIAQYLSDIGDFPQITSLEVANPQGFRWTGKNKIIGIINVSQSDFFLGVMKSGRPYIADANESKVFTDKIEFIAGFPIFNKEHQIENILYAPVWSSQFSTILRKLNLVSGGNLHVLDSKSNLLLSTTGEIKELKTYNSADKFMAEKKVMGTSWRVIVDRNKSDVIKTVLRKILFDLLFIILVLIPIVCVLLLFIAQINKQKHDLLKSNKKLQGLADTDGLTGLLNHRAFQETLSRCLKSADHNNPLTLILMDIDNFKIFNDQYGHQVGDAALKHISRILKSFLKNTGFIARYGGEEFVIILPKTDHQNGLDMAQSLSAIIDSTPLPIDNKSQARISVSIGLSAYPKDASDRENLIRFADRALYRAKEHGSNKVQMYYSVLEELRDNIECDQDLMKVIHTLNTIINAKDKYTYGHSERVMKYAAKLASHMGLPKEDIDNITVGAFLHDIGKIEINGEILNKPGKLTAEEFEHIRKHPIVGADIIKPIKSLKKTIDFALYHHERYDGKGYPFGLKGRNIPLYGKIGAVVDSFDAMTTNRPYQEARTKGDALQEIQRCAGTQFDPEIVACFIDMLNSPGSEENFDTLSFNKKNL